MVLRINTLSNNAANKKKYHRRIVFALSWNIVQPQEFIVKTQQNLNK